MKSIVLTGSHGLGKTSLLEAVCARSCEHVKVVPDARRMLFPEGLPLTSGSFVLAAALQAVVRLQHRLEHAARSDGRSTTLLCDGGSLDALTSWPLDSALFFSELASSERTELLRYTSVIVLRRALRPSGQRTSEIRLVGAQQAASEERPWRAHPRLNVLDVED